MDPLTYQVVLFSSLTLVFGGVAALAATRSLVKIVMGLQSISLGALLLIALAIGLSGRESYTLILLSAATATASEAVSIAVLILAYRRFGTLDPRKISELRW